MGILGDGFRAGMKYGLAAGSQARRANRVLRRSAYVQSAMASMGPKMNRMGRSMGRAAVSAGRHYEQTAGARRSTGNAVMRSAQFVRNHPYGFGGGAAALGMASGIKDGLGPYISQSSFGRNLGPVARSVASSQMYGYGGGRMAQNMGSQVLRRTY